MKKTATEKGIIKLIILIIVALLVLSYFGISLRALVNTPTNQDNISYTTSTVENVWNTYLKAPARYLWNDIFIALIWDPAIQNLQNLRDNQPSTIQDNAPVIPNTQQVPN